MRVFIFLLLAFLLHPCLPYLFVPTSFSTALRSSSSEDDASILHEKAASLRREAEELRASLPTPVPSPSSSPAPPGPPKPAHVYGANGQLGSWLTRTVLRTTSSPVFAHVHDASRSSKLSYTVGAEDGQGSIEPAWRSREQSMSYTSSMRSYGLDRLTLLETEVLQAQPRLPAPVKAFYCASDYRGVVPRAVASFEPGLLYRALVNPLKGRVEVEGLFNVLDSLPAGSELVLPSVGPTVKGDYVTPLGDFQALKKESVRIAQSRGGDIKVNVVELPKIDTLRESDGRPVVRLKEEGGEEGRRCRWVSPEDAGRLVAEVGGGGVWVVVDSQS